MDNRNGQSREAAKEAGVPEEHIKEVRTMMSGPFKGRRYVYNLDGSRGKRVRPDATKEELNGLATN